MNFWSLKRLSQNFWKFFKAKIFSFKKWPISRKPLTLSKFWGDFLFIPLFVISPHRFCRKNFGDGEALFCPANFQKRPKKGQNRRFFFLFVDCSPKQWCRVDESVCPYWTDTAESKSIIWFGFRPKFDMVSSKIIVLQTCRLLRQFRLKTEFWEKCTTKLWKEKCFRLKKGRAIRLCTLF